MVDCYLSATFDVNSPDGFGQNTFYGQRRTTDDGLLRLGNSFADTQFRISKRQTQQFRIVRDKQQFGISKTNNNLG